jgi:uncharacterized membrane protein
VFCVALHSILFLAHRYVARFAFPPVLAQAVPVLAHAVRGALARAHRVSAFGTSVASFARAFRRGRRRRKVLVQIEVVASFVTEDDFVVVLKGVALVLVHRHLHHKPIGNLPSRPHGKREEPHEVERESLSRRLTSSTMMVVLFQIVLTSSHY